MTDPIPLTPSHVGSKPCIGTSATCDCLPLLPHTSTTTTNASGQCYPLAPLALLSAKRYKTLLSPTSRTSDTSCCLAQRRQHYMPKVPCSATHQTNPIALTTNSSHPELLLRQNEINRVLFEQPGVWLLAGTCTPPSPGPPRGGWSGHHFVALGVRVVGSLLLAHLARLLLHLLQDVLGVTVGAVAFFGFEGLSLEAGGREGCCLYDLSAVAYARQN